jgi:hypothetical protein
MISVRRLSPFVVVCPLRYYQPVAPLALERGQATLPDLQKKGLEPSFWGSLSTAIPPQTGFGCDDVTASELMMRPTG